MELLFFPEFLAGLKSLDDSFDVDPQLRSQYLVTTVSNAGPPWELQTECYYRLKHYPDLPVNQLLGSLLTAAEVMLIDEDGDFAPAAVEPLKSQGYCVKRIEGGPLNTWSLAQLTGRNFTFYFG